MERGKHHRGELVIISSYLIAVDGHSQEEGETLEGEVSYVVTKGTQRQTVDVHITSEMKPGDSLYQVVVFHVKVKHNAIGKHIGKVSHEAERSEVVERT